MDERETGRIILEARGVMKAFPGVVALDGVDLAAYAGRVHVVVGENGAGKSTLMNVLAGVLAPDRGVILLDGREVALRSAREAMEHGIAIIHQELNLAPQLSVAENIFLGREFVGPFGLIDYGRMNREALRLLEQLETDLDPRSPAETLRVGEQQIVEIAKALSCSARVLILDEPTSAISEHEVEVLFRLIEGLKTRGAAILYISHKLDELFRIGDWITVLRDGRVTMSAPLEGVGREQVVRAMAGRELRDLYRRIAGAGGEEALRAEHLFLDSPQPGRPPLVRDLSFHVRRGEVLGVFGLMGAGRTELLETIFGMHPDRSRGRIFIRGAETRIRSPRDAIAAGVGLAPEDRKGEGLVLSMDVAANISLASLPQVERFGLLSRRRETALADDYIRRLGVKTPSLRQIVQRLSGGNQQKVVLAKWLATKPLALLLDEPTRGIDVNAKSELYELVDRLTRTGLGVVFVSSELPEILTVSDRILVMAEGRKTAELDRAAATEEEILNAALNK